MPYEEAFAALAHPLRQQILDALQETPATVRELTDQLDASQPVVSQHLKVLRETGLVRATPDGVKRVYQIRPDRLQELRTFLEEHWKNALSGLAKDPTHDA